jgi:capsular exopolysaccharide synthesis family protein
MMLPVLAPKLREVVISPLQWLSSCGRIYGASCVVPEQPPVSNGDERAGDDLRRVLAILRRRAWILIVCAVAATGIAYAVSASKPKTYAATAALLFQQDELSQQLFGYGVVQTEDPTEIAATNLNLLTQNTVAGQTAQRLGHSYSAGLVRSAVTVGQAGASDVMQVTASARRPERAALIANTYAQVFIEFRQATDRAQVAQATAQLKAEILQLQATPGGAAQIPNLKQRLNQLSVLAAVQTGDVQIAGSATVPTSASSPRPKRAAALGLFGGLIFGFLVLFLVERFDKSVRDVEEASRLLGLPIIGTIPTARELSRGRTPRASTGSAAVGEAFGLLIAQLRYFNVDRKIGSVTMTSGGMADGKSTVAWNVAVAAAALTPESSVLVVDCDLRRPSIAEISGLGPVTGLTELLTHAIDRDDAIHVLEVAWPPGGELSTKLSVLAAGSPAPNPSELMQSQTFRSLIEELKAEYDFIVFDAPPPTIVSDAMPVLSEADGVLVVVRVRLTRRDGVKRLRELLSRLGIPALGMVLNDVSSRGGYGYGYGAYADGGAAKGRGRRLVRKTPPVRDRANVGSQE